MEGRDPERMLPTLGLWVRTDREEGEDNRGSWLGQEEEGSRGRKVKIA